MLLVKLQVSNVLHLIYYLHVRGGAHFRWGSLFYFDSGFSNALFVSRAAWLCRYKFLLRGIWILFIILRVGLTIYVFAGKRFNIVSVLYCLFIPCCRLGCFLLLPCFLCRVVCSVRKRQLRIGRQKGADITL